MGGGGQAFCDAIRHIAEKNGEHFLKYDECKDPARAKVDDPTIHAHKEYLSAVQQHTKNLSVPRTVVEGGMKLILETSLKMVIRLPWISP